MKLLLLVLICLEAGAVGWPFRCVGCERNAHGSIVRSSAARKQFMVASGFPKGRKGWVVDHIIPLACATASEPLAKLDVPINMQWQIKADAAVKDTWEIKLCDKGPGFGWPVARKYWGGVFHQRIPDLR